MNRKVYVANLPPQATEPEIRDFFSKAGSAMSVKIVYDRQTRQPRGITFVEMSYAMGRTKSRFHAEPTGFHGEKRTG